MPYRHLYLHVPFCTRRCSYCDFSIAVRRNVPVDAFVNGVRSELQTRRHSQPGMALETLYLGGGTPSRLGADGIRRVLDTVREFGELTANAEVTLEANPEDITADAVGAWREAGINRLSIGVQSFDDRVLRWMHRAHDAQSAVRAVNLARDEGLDAYSLDLIFAVPTELERDWSRDLDAALALAPDHVSLYGLTIETHTPLGRWEARGDVIASPEERYEVEFLAAHRALGAAGFEHYEVSNFAKPDRRARHNGAYWRNVAYLGIGPSAHGFDGDQRRWNISAYAAWLVAVAAGRDPLEGCEQLTHDNRTAEAVYLGLRTIDGLEFTQAEAETVRSWFDAGWLEWIDADDNRRVRCTPMGWLRLDRLAGDLTALRSRS